jgi:hypothetical protein
MSSDNGFNWTTTYSGIPTSTQVYALTNLNNYLFAGTNAGSGIYKSTDNGVSWIPSGTGLTTIVYDFAVMGNTIFAGGEMGRIFMSTDYGTSWTQCKATLPNDYIEHIRVNGNYLFAGTDENGIFRSTDNGNSWTLINSGLVDNYIRSLEVFGTTIFAGTVNGLHYSTNNGDSWSLINSEMGNRAIISLDITNTNILAGTWGGGVWRKSTSSVLAVERNKGGLPMVFQLDQNYPNPFNPSTTINYSLAKEGHVKLTVYNSIGCKIATIADENKPAGNYSVQFNGSKFPSGVYFYRLESGNYSAVKKFILMK